METDNPRLQVINDWLRHRLEEPAQAKGTASLLTRFVKQELRELTDKLWHGNPDELIITVRTSFRKDNLYLRPVYSQPEQLRKFFQDPAKQKPFSFADKTAAFEDVQLYENPERDNKPYAFAGLYEINTASAPPDSFRARINDFHQAMCATEGLTELTTKARWCFFAGRNKDDKKVPLIELKHILAVYFPSINKVENEAAMLETLLNNVAELFDGLDLISLIDASLFEAEGLRLVAELLPEFSRDDVAPADQIAFALERLRALLNRHMIGRHGGEEGGESPRLSYLATSFERAGKIVYPRLEIYPHVYRKEFIEASYFVTHRRIPSATKFLLLRYLKSNKQLVVETTSQLKERNRGKFEPQVECDPDFEELFDEKRLKTIPLQQWQNMITPPDKPDFLHLTTSDAQKPTRDARQAAPDLQTPWKALNKPLDPNLRSIAAFVVEGRIVDTVKIVDSTIPKRCLPRGIFAIESHYEDGFSDADIKSLRMVFQGIAALIRLISHQNAPIDYRSLIANTFKQDAELWDRKNPRVSRLIFLVQKVDAELLASLLQKCRASNGHLDMYGLEAGSLAALEQIAAICPPADKPTPEERAEILEKRLKRLQELLSAKDEAQKQQFLAEDVLAFLEACPENFTWASYLACMAQTLGDRIAGTQLPRFRRMLPGFSASGMFMAMVDGELRQVVKLSNANRLKKENRRYRKWVRYRLVNAARIPGNGLAFETTGEAGRNCALENNEIITPISSEQDNASDGVLVSDLVSGGEANGEVNTLLDLIVSHVGLLNHNPPNLATILDSLRAVFDRNATLWKSLPADEEYEDDPLTAALKAFRIPTPHSDAGDKIQFENDISRLKTLSKTNTTDLSFKGILKAFRPAAPNSLDNLQREHFRICHGDLNARNLTWAEALRTFFLIDFEWVGPGVVGTDQFRLIVSLITELRSGWEALGQQNENGLAKLYSEVENGVGYLSEVFSHLIGKDRTPNGIDSVATLAQKKYCDSKLADTLGEVMKTLAVETPKTADWRWFWALMTLCAMMKQFSYSCRMVKENETVGVLNGRRFDEISSLGELETMVQRYVQDKPGLKNMVPSFMSYFIAAKSLLSFVAWMESAKGTDA